MNLKIFSKALYSNWGYHYPTRTLFDCGEGCATALGNEIYGPERICIGHGNHPDHTSGLHLFLGCRNSGRGDRNKALDIYAPESKSFTNLKEYIIKESGNYLRYSVNWSELDIGIEVIIDINKKTYISSFPVHHTYNSRGYKVMEIRQKLKDGITPDIAKELKRDGQNIYDIYHHPTFVWLLDSHTFDLFHIQNAVHVVFDATFLTAKDCDKGDTHSSVEEVLLWARDAKVKRATLAHISTRYSAEEVTATVAKLTESIGYQGQVDIVLGDKIYEF